MNRGSNEVPDDLFAARSETSGSGSKVEDNKFKHPVCVFFHLFWKVAAMIIYLLGSWKWTFTTIFIACVTLFAFDFWTVKNISGRLLVGLRWWNEIEEDGTSVWMFESQEDAAAISAKEKMIFWTALFMTPVLWVVFGIASFFSLKVSWLLIVAVGLVLQMANVVGYVKCARRDQKQMASMAQDYLTRSLINQASKGTSSVEQV